MKLKFTRKMPLNNKVIKKKLKVIDITIIILYNELKDAEFSNMNLSNKIIF